MSASPPAKQPKLSCPIHLLADTDLSEIFKWLPPFERLIVSEVCRRWHEISRKSWLDMKALDLSPISGKYIGAIVRQCPNLQSAFAAGKSFGFRELTCLSKSPSITGVQFFGCDFTLCETHDIIKNIFSDRLGHSALVELILHDALFRIEGRLPHLFVTLSAQSFPATLTHLLLSGLRVTPFTDQAKGLFLDGLEKLVNLECFILCSTPDRVNASDEYRFAEELTADAFSEAYILTTKIARLKNLRELCIGPAWLLDWEQTSFTRLISALSKLEVLFLCNVDGEEIAEGLVDLVQTDSALRILVLSGGFDADEAVELPVRKRFPRVFGAAPLPLLHIFVGKEASENIRFAKSSDDPLVVHPINAPMPEFLEREEIAPIFAGVWVAEKIKEAAKLLGGKLWDYQTQDTARSIQRML